MMRICLFSLLPNCLYTTGLRTPSKISSFLLPGFVTKPRFLASNSNFSVYRQTRTMATCASVVLVPTLTDNYAYIFVDPLTKRAGCVDPAEPEKVVEAAAKHGVKLELCLCTHKHADHSGGNVALRQLVPGIEVVGSAYEETPGCTKTVKHDDTLEFGELVIRAYHTPCHTAGHMIYVLSKKSNPEIPNAAFTGDTLFVGGCGRFFEGSAKDMNHALMDVCAAFTPNTLVYCGHEYTESNLKFALSIEPDNLALKSKMEWVKAQRAQGLPTIPSTIQEELSFNPFMRVNLPSVQQAVHKNDAVETMGELRERKNNF